MNCQIVLIDVDGVMAEHTAKFIKQLNKHFGTDYEYEDVRTFDYRDSFPPEHAEFLFQMWHGTTLYDGLEPEPGAMEAVRQMRSFSRVIAFSTPMLGHIKSKYAWLMEQGFSQNDILFAKDKSLVPGAVLIDDRIENLLGFTGKAICFTRPWNAKWDLSAGLRTDDWNEIVSAVRATICDE